jgi:hypothetical protein
MAAHHLERSVPFDVTIQDVRLVWLVDPAANEIKLPDTLQRELAQAYASTLMRRARPRRQSDTPRS